MQFFGDVLYPLFIVALGGLFVLDHEPKGYFLKNERRRGVECVLFAIQKSFEFSAGLLVQPVELFFGDAVLNFPINIAVYAVVFVVQDFV